MWETILSFIAPAIAPVGAAAVAGYFAVSTKRSDQEAQRTRDLESRISERKFETYKPMIDRLQKMLDGGLQNDSDVAEMKEEMTQFATWIGVWGSDEAIRAYHNFTQAAFHDAPPAIMMRFYGDFLLEARRDLGNPDSQVQRQHLLGMRITDIYDMSDTIDPCLQEVCNRAGWEPPWDAEHVVPARS